MQFSNFTQEEILHEDRMGPGTYDYQGSEASEQVSKAGNAMLKVVLNVTSEQGNSIQIHDYLVANVRWKLKQFALSCGLELKLKSGELGELDVIHKSGRCEVVLEKSDKGEFLKVKKYIKTTGEDIVEPLEEDDIPF